MRNRLILFFLLLFILGGCADDEEKISLQKKMSILKNNYQSLVDENQKLNHKINNLELNITKLIQKNISLLKDNEFLRLRYKDLNLSKIEKDDYILKLSNELEKERNKSLRLNEELLELRYNIKTKYKKEVEDEIIKKADINFSNIKTVGFSIITLLSLILIALGLYIYKLRIKLKQEKREISEIKDKLSKLQIENEKLEHKLKSSEQNKIIELINGYQNRRLNELRDIVSGLKEK